MNVLSQILRDNRFTPEDIPDLENKLFLMETGDGPYLVRFTVLLFLSTIIATYGVLGDSTATVIGAMIVAPLMTPILATTAALVMGRARRAARSILIVIGGVIMVIALSAFIGWINITVISVTLNSQIASRTAPSLDDLIVALAAGAAGAFAYSRADVADSLPGVAVAIALVPPLSVVGITLSLGDWDAAGGAMLLFLTNLLSILLAGGAVFALLNLGGASIEGRDLSREKQRRVYSYIAIGVILITLPLALATFSVARSGSAHLQTRDITLDWLERNQIALELQDVNVTDQSVEIVVNGSTEPESLAELRVSLENAFPEMEEAIMRINVARVFPLPRTIVEEG